MADIDRDTYVCTEYVCAGAGYNKQTKSKKCETGGWGTPTYPPSHPAANQETAQTMASPPLADIVRKEKKTVPIPWFRAQEPGCAESAKCHHS